MVDQPGGFALRPADLVDQVRVLIDQVAGLPIQLATLVDQPGGLALRPTGLVDQVRVLIDQVAGLID